MGHDQVQRHPRHRVCIAAELIHEGMIELRPVTILDLSLGGARLADASPPPPGTEVRLRVAFDAGSAPVALCARVVHVIPAGDEAGRPAGMGIAFAMAEPVRDVVRRALDRIARELGDEDGASWAPLPAPNAPAPVDL